MKTADRAWYAAVRDAARAAIARGRGGRWDLPGGGLLEVERPTPFFVIGRVASDAAVERLSGGIASRLLVPADASHGPGTDALARSVVEALADHFPAVCAIWIGAVASVGHPEIVLRMSPDRRWDSIADPIAGAMRSIAFDGIVMSASMHREVPSHARLAIGPDLREKVCEIEIDVPAIFRSPIDRRVYPVWLDELRRSLARALGLVIDAFTARSGAGTPRARIGTWALDPAARRADRVLCEAADTFEVLVQLTPSGLDAMWQRLVETRFEEEPIFRYRPLPFDPVVIKRKVLEAPVEEIEDPFVAELLREKQEELERMLSMLRDRGDKFLHDSEHLFGRPDRTLLELADRIFASKIANDRREEALPLDAVLVRTRAHMRAYRDQDPLFPDELELRDDVAAGLMVSRGRLLLRPDIAFSANRLDALLEHEVGTHVLTWFNGSSQPLRLLGVGLAGYEPLQEGLAVLAEYLAGGLDPARLRVLAARVVAADRVAQGATFLEVFHRLRELRIDDRTAFQTTVRALRGGGMTKDLVYLRGLLDLGDHLGNGGALEPLYGGKISLAQLPVIESLAERGMIGAPRVLPRVLSMPGAKERLDRLRRAGSPIDVVLALASEELAA